MRAKAVPVHSRNLPNECGAQTASVFTPLVKCLFISNIGRTKHAFARLPLAGQLPSSRIDWCVISLVSGRQMADCGRGDAG
jgi:hypothetical protein